MVRRQSPVETALVRAIDAFPVGIARHWLPALLIALGIFVTLPFLAPVAMAAGWVWLGKLIYVMYIPFCHQLPQRSWFLFGPQLTYRLDEIAQVYPFLDPWRLRFFYGTAEMGWKVAWSDRMISFFGLLPVFGLLYAGIRRWRRPAPRPLSLWLFLAALTPLALDGLTHLVNDALFGVAGGFLDTNAWLAKLTENAFPGFYAGDHYGTFNWWMRLVTGALGAWAIVFFGFPWLNRLFRDDQAK
ncbi:MAG: hypothetical protein RML36_10200 [Anaerolineae bacterium]|nr:hypothetical protein [Anaerolineae bacterium]MDW8099838.1 hypothetical protein [Anaerolineae bacterium]